MNSDHVADRVEQFVRAKFRVKPTDSRFGREVDLFDGGYVDSVGVAELIGFLESEFGVEPSEEDLFSDDFTHIDGIARIVCRLAGGGS